MLKKDKTLNIKNIKGKRIYSRGSLVYFFLFYLPVLTIVLPALIIFPIDEFIAQFSWDSVAPLLIVSLSYCAILALAFLIDRLWLTDLLCVLTDDTIYFVKAEVTELSKSSRRKRSTFCDGSVDYTDIKEMEYVPEIRKYRTEHIILRGTDFSLTIWKAQKNLIRAIKKHQRLLHCATDNATDLPNFDTIKHDRHGIFQDFWTTLEAGKADSIFDPQTSIIHLDLDEQTNIIMLHIERNGHHIEYQIDTDGLFMYCEDNEADDSISFGDKKDLNDLFIRMQHFAVKNS